MNKNSTAITASNTQLFLPLPDITHCVVEMTNDSSENAMSSSDAEKVVIPLVNDNYSFLTINPTFEQIQKMTSCESFDGSIHEDEHSEHYHHQQFENICATQSAEKSSICPPYASRAKKSLNLLNNVLNSPMKECVDSTSASKTPYEHPVLNEMNSNNSVEKGNDVLLNDFQSTKTHSRRNSVDNSAFATYFIETSKSNNNKSKSRRFSAPSVSSYENDAFLNGILKIRDRQASNHSSSRSTSSRTSSSSTTSSRVRRAYRRFSDITSLSSSSSESSTVGTSSRRSSKVSFESNHVVAEFDKTISIVDAKELTDYYSQSTKEAFRKTSYVNSPRNSNANSSTAGTNLMPYRFEYTSNARYHAKRIRTEKFKSWVFGYTRNA